MGLNIFFVFLQELFVKNSAAVPILWCGGKCKERGGAGTGAGGGGRVPIGQYSPGIYLTVQRHHLPTGVQYVSSAVSLFTNNNRKSNF